MEPLTVSGTLDSLATIGKYVLDAAALAGLDKKAAYRLRLAVDEIATNVITHGYQEANRQGDLEVQVLLDEAALTLFLEDNGAAYIPDEVSAPDGLQRPLEERQIGGLGVYLAIQSVDRFLYERVGGRNRHTFVVNRVRG
jgi:anti-sigma regulatory factor (Ser/Thr protein kinase)